MSRIPYPRQMPLVVVAESAAAMVAACGTLLTIAHRNSSKHRTAAASLPSASESLRTRVLRFRDAQAA